MGASHAKLIQQIITVGKTAAPVLDPEERIEFISTGSMLFDARIGGFPRRRISIISGLQNSGKTTLWMLAAKEVIENGGSVLVIDSERSFANEWALLLGIDRTQVDANGVPVMTVVQPENAESALQIYINAIKADYHQMIVLDSVAKLNPASESELDFTKDPRLGQQASILSRVCRVSGPLLRASTSKPAVIFVNQIRDKIQEDYSGHSQMPGGKAIRFDAGLWLETLKPKDVLSSDGAVLERLTIRARQVKNKVFPWNRLELYVHLDFDPEAMEYSVNQPSEVYEVAAMYDVFESEDGSAWKPGKTAYFRGQKLTNGQDKIVELITSDYDLFKALKEAINERRTQARERTDDPFPDASDGGNVSVDDVA